MDNRSITALECLQIDPEVIGMSVDHIIVYYYYWNFHHERQGMCVSIPA
jgi:hypothetical protein